MTKNCFQLKLFFLGKMQRQPWYDNLYLINKINLILPNDEIYSKFDVITSEMKTKENLLEFIIKFDKEYDINLKYSTQRIGHLDEQFISFKPNTWRT